MLLKFVKCLLFGFVLLLFSVPVLGGIVNLNLYYDGKDHTYHADEIILLVNGERVTPTQMPPVSINARAYVPVREVFEAMGATVEWFEDTREILIGYNEELLVMKVGQQAANLNGQSIQLEMPPKMINNKAMVPVRFAAEAFGIYVGWQGSTRTVTIGDSGETNLPVETPQQVLPSSSENQTLSARDVSPEQLTAQQHPDTEITAVAASASAFTVTAAGPISRVEKQLLEGNKLVLDIYGATNQLQSSYSGFAFAGVKEVRSSQFQQSPKVTRVVLEMQGAQQYEVSMSGDRKVIQIKFLDKTIQNIAFSQSGSNDVVTVTGSASPVASVSRLFGPDRIVVDFQAAQSGLNQNDFNYSGTYVSQIRTSQHDSSTVRMVLDLKDNADYSVSYNGNNAVIELKAPTYKNLNYSNNEGYILKLYKAGSGITASGIIKNDDYRNKRYTVTLPGNFLQTYGYGTIKIGDSALNGITIHNNAQNNTELVFDEAKIMELVIEETSDYISIRALPPKSVYNRVIVIDAGHGDSDGGASGNGVVEKSANLAIIRRLHTLLENDPDIKVYVTRLDDSYPTNASRAAMANEIAHLFMSVHHNSSTNKSANGTETLYNVHANEPMNGFTSQIYAQIVQNNLMASIGMNSRGIVSRPDLIVLNQTNVPAVLVEVGFVSNGDDAAKIKDEAFQQNVAQALYVSIKQVFDQYDL